MQWKLGHGLVLACAILMVLPGCPNGSTRYGGITVDGNLRTYLMHRPPLADDRGPYPVVLVLHGVLDRGKQMMDYMGFNEIANREGFIVVYPNGIDNRWRTLGIGRDGIDDVKFISALLDRLISVQDVDPERIYVVGASNGAMMAAKLACELGDRIAGIAPIMGASLPTSLVADCSPGLPMPVIAIHGDADPVLPYEGILIEIGDIPPFGMLPVEDSVAVWRSNNGCGDTATVIDLPDLDPVDGATVRRTDWTDCGGAPVTLCTVVGGGHTWPGVVRPTYVGVTSMDIDASQVVWDFLKGHRRPGAGQS